MLGFGAAMGGGDAGNAAAKRAATRILFVITDAPDRKGLFGAWGRTKESEERAVFAMVGLLRIIGGADVNAHDHVDALIAQLDVAVPSGPVFTPASSGSFT
jgi:hypothetical protein